MEQDKIAALVDQWVDKWRLYLDGGLHQLARADLIKRIGEFSPVQEPGKLGQEPEKRRVGRPSKSSMGEG